MGPEDRWARRPLMMPAYLNCPVCGDNHALRTTGRTVYLECPQVAPGQAVDVGDPMRQAIVRRVTAAWN